MFSGVSPSAGLHSSSYTASCLLGLPAPEGGLEGCVSETWGLPGLEKPRLSRRFHPGERPHGTFFLKLGWSWRAGSYCLIDKRPEDRTWGLWWVWLVVFFCWRQEAGSDRGHGAKASQGGEGCGIWPQSAVLGNSEACCSLPTCLPAWGCSGKVPRRCEWRKGVDWV